MEMTGRNCARTSRRWRRGRYEGSRPTCPGLPLDARLCLRRYPPGHTGQRLGAHVDDTLCTLLWASTPGLEILAPQDDAAWTGPDVAKVGLPTMGPPPKTVEGDDWATVTPPSADCFLFTPGNGWGGIVALPCARRRCIAWPSAATSSACRCLCW